MVRISLFILTIKSPPQILSDPQIFHSPARFGVIELSVISVRDSGMKSVDGSVTTMDQYDVLRGAKKQRTRVTLRYRIVTITAAYELLGST